MGTYRVTGSAGGWRNVPWPFGFLDVTPISLTLRSWHWSWWVPDLTIPLVDVESVNVVRRFGLVGLRPGVALVTFRAANGREMRITATTPDPLLDELRNFAYPVPLTQ